MELLNGVIHQIYQTVQPQHILYLYIINKLKAHSLWDIGIITVINGYKLHVLRESYYVYQDGAPFIAVKGAFYQRKKQTEFPVWDYSYELQPMRAQNL